MALSRAFSYNDNTSNSELKHFDELTIDEIGFGTSMTETDSRVIEVQVDSENIETQYKENKEFIVNSANKISSPTYSEILNNANTTSSEVATTTFNLLKQMQSASTEQSGSISAPYTNTITESSAAYTSSNISISEANEISGSYNSSNSSGTGGLTQTFSGGSSSPNSVGSSGGIISGGGNINNANASTGGYSNNDSGSSITSSGNTSVAGGNSGITNSVTGSGTSNISTVGNVSGSASSGGASVSGSTVFANTITTKENSISGSMANTTQSRVAAALDGTSNGITNAINQIGNAINTTAENRLQATDALNSTLLGLSNSLDMTQVSSSTANSFFGTLGSILETMASVTQPYKDGVSETSYGAGVEDGWNNFLSSFQGTFFKSSPLDSQDGQKALYGNMMLGSPFLFNQGADPRNRTLINSLIKDGRYITFTPGLPKYNGTSYTAGGNDKYDNQTKSTSQMMAYLEMNGLTKDFSNKDKRYYTFKADYETYYAYLDAMLNTIWVKMGLGKGSSPDKPNLFTFFNGNSLKPQYKSSIGFFTNIAGTVSEDISNQITGIGAELAGEINGNSDDYQRMNYITGMGGGSAFQKTMRSLGGTVTATKQLGSKLSSTFADTISAASEAIHTSSEDLVTKIANYIKIPISFANDVMEFTNTQDLGAVIQSFAVSNGMKVMYPELWSNSVYTKTASFTFNFTSPYGDPLSIFKYVYVPFCALACLAMPRQAAENGYVSPMFVRADVPGLMCSDLALISSFTFTKGGNGGTLWTKDGLPRSIEVAITLTDLYPYLAMTKHFTALSSNPSYAVFLDSMSGMMSLNNDKKGDGLNEYFKALLKRVSGDNNKNSWNKFNSIKNESVKKMSEQARATVSATVDPFAIPWLHNSSL